MAISRSPSTRVEASVSASHRPAALTATAWSPVVELPIGVWVRQGRLLGELGRASGWWIGDWIRYGNARYGERYEPAARLTGYDVHSLRNMAYVAGRFEVPRRRACLSFGHHAELAGLPAEEQELWLDRAEAGGLSVRVCGRGCARRGTAPPSQSLLHERADAQARQYAPAGRGLR